MAYKPQILAVADGGTGITSSLPIVQQLINSSASVITCSKVVPYDDTIPQSSEMDTVISQAITPTNTSNIITVEFFGYATTNPLNVCTIGVFQDATADASFAATISTGPGNQISPSIFYSQTAGTVSSTTFTIRAGVFSATNIWFNGNSSGTRIYGGVSKCWIILTEYSV